MGNRATVALPPVGVEAPRDGDAALVAAVAGVLGDFSVPAVGVGVVRATGAPRLGCVGWRRAGEWGNGVRCDDVWHIGSCTKAFTATLLRSVLDEHKLSFDTRLCDVLPAADARLTLRHLLQHTSGLPANGNYLTTRDRAGFARLKPSFAPGARYAYGNVNYILLGAVIEKLTSLSWEAAVRARVFAHLQINSAGFGPTTVGGGRADQPWPHDPYGEVKAVPKKVAVDNPAILGPAGRIHLSLQDWAVFLQQRYLSEGAEPPLEVPIGWVECERDWANGTCYTHSGSNTMNYATVWVAPAAGLAVVAACNMGGERAQQACNAAIERVLRAEKLIS